MVDQTQLEESKSIHKRTGKTFYYATRLLPERVREATYVLYAFFRVADEVVDNPVGMAPSEQREQLEEIRRAALGEESTEDPVLSAFSELRETYDIPEEEVDVFIDAMIADIDTDRYETYEELEVYMSGSASAVGVMMTVIMDTDEEEKAIPHARRLGEAFQLTNFVRDVREDILELDRIYLPQETLDAYGADSADIEALEYTDEIGDAIRHELRRAERLYREGVAGIKYLPRDCQLPVLTAAVLYAEHHRLVRELDYDTVSERPSLSTFRKLSLVVRTRWHWMRHGDPETVFAKVSAVPMDDGRAPQTRSEGPLPTH